MMNIQILKQRLISDDEFAETFNSFYDLIEFNKVVAENSTPIENEQLRDLVDITAKRMARNPNLIFVDFRIMDVPNTPFQHGMAISRENQMFAFFFFHDINKGMLSMAKRGSDEVVFARITGVPMDHDHLTSTINLN